MDLNELKEEAQQALEDISDPKYLESLRIKYLGRKGEVTQILRSLSKKSLAERKKVGKAANQLKQELNHLFDIKLKELKAATDQQINLDITQPGARVQLGHLHPLTQVENQIRKIFQDLNFSVIEGPEVESSYNNFDALNIPADHPARDMWDTFWLKDFDNLLLRTHTSPMQVRYMRENKPPFQIIVPGRVFRYEATDASHEINFYQFEGLMVGDDVSLANFKYVVGEFFKKFFNKKVKIRFRPSYFPFTEPSVEVDIQIPGKKDWLEVMGAGLVHPNVLKAVGYNPKHYQGFAFGGGVDRLAMLKYGIDDVRLFYNGDVRFVQQF